MFITRYIVRLKRWWFYRNTRTDFYYSPTLPECLALLDIAASTLLERCTPRVLMQKPVLVVYSDLDMLVKTLNRAIVAANEHSVFEHQSPPIRRRVLLDDYLVDDQDRPVTAVTTKTILRSALLALDQTVNQTEDPIMLEYYQRVFTIILVDVINITEALLDVAVAHE